MNDIVVLTPTYNRANTLLKLYESLKKQENNNFIWLIIDDGSTDGTRQLIKRFNSEKIINLQYYYQTNGGKARALNTGFSKCDVNTLIMVVDSDDYLLPSAINTVLEYNNKYENNREVGGFFFHYNTPDGKLLNFNGNEITKDEILTRYEYNEKYKQNDGCVCYFGKAIKKYRYPEFDGEKYVGPTVIQMEMSDEYKFVFSPKVVGVAEYLEGGLSNSGRKLRMKNPLGMIHYCNLMITPKVSVFKRLKYSISIWPYAKIANKSFLEIIRLVSNPVFLVISYIPGQILFYMWKRK
ncbi:MAG: glycosyltransferase family A protein [Bacillota bacterium]